MTMIGVVLGMIAIVSYGSLSAAAQTYTGTCEGLKQYIAANGIRDANGVQHKGAEGVTTITFDGCKDTEILKPHVEKSLNGFERCYGATASIACKFHVTVGMLQWVASPAPCDSCGCSVAVKDWQNKLAAHEELHRQVDQAAINYLEQEFKSFPVRGCVSLFQGSNWKAAIPQFEKEIMAEVRSVIAETEAKNQNIDTGSTILPDCAKCNVCKADEQPFCSVPTPCGPLVAGIYQNCGLSPAKQPVACCAYSAYPQGICSPWGTSACPPTPLSLNRRDDVRSFGALIEWK